MKKQGKQSREGALLSKLYQVSEELSVEGEHQHNSCFDEFDELASHVEATMTQAFNVRTRKDSSKEESDGGDTQIMMMMMRESQYFPMKRMKQVNKLQRVT